VVHDCRSFDAAQVLRALSDNRATFTSLVPTQYVLLLELGADVFERHPVDHVKRLMISSAPARKETKLAIMQSFANSQLFELYGSTEAGFVTILRPDEQITKLGSVGREWSGTGPVRILDENGNDVPDGEIGELYSWTPFAFTGYWNLPEKTAEAFRGRYCTVGDMAYRDTDGFYHLVDRKSNMIISGGENIYPTEVEALLARHPAVRDVAVIGIPDAKWGEAVHAIVVRKPGTDVTEDALVEWCRDQIAGYKRPRSFRFIADGDMPRTATGKIQHRVLRDRLRTASEGR
jgi:acyl-CoA synthetase (AMP-forming)/AMP-acid ligase II